MGDRASTYVSADIRKLVYDDLAEVYIQAIANAQITEQQETEIARTVLAGVDGAATYGQLISFLLQLSNRWSIYRNVYEKYQRNLMRD